MYFILKVGQVCLERVRLIHCIGNVVELNMDSHLIMQTWTKQAWGWRAPWWNVWTEAAANVYSALWGGQEGGPTRITAKHRYISPADRPSWSTGCNEKHWNMGHDTGVCWPLFKCLCRTTVMLWMASCIFVLCSAAFHSSPHSFPLKKTRLTSFIPPLFSILMSLAAGGELRFWVIATGGCECFFCLCIDDLYWRESKGWRIE